MGVIIDLIHDNIFRLHNMLDYLQILANSSVLTGSINSIEKRKILKVIYGYSSLALLGVTLGHRQVVIQNVKWGYLASSELQLQFKNLHHLFFVRQNLILLNVVICCICFTSNEKVLVIAADLVITFGVPPDFINICIDRLSYIRICIYLSKFVRSKNHKINGFGVEDINEVARVEHYEIGHLRYSSVEIKVHQREVVNIFRWWRYKIFLAHLALSKVDIANMILRHFLNYFMDPYDPGDGPVILYSFVARFLEFRRFVRKILSGTVDH